jgi:DNA-binding transcriptional regulator YiaG
MEEKMPMKKEIYIFTGFGFDVLLHNVEIKEVHGETYPDIDMNEVKLLTAKELLKGRERLTGKKLKFLRTFLKLSYQKLSEIIDVPASTLRTWEDKGSDATGLSVPQERQLRVFSIDSLLDLEKKHFEKQIIMAESFDWPLSNTAVDLGLARDYSFLKEA